MDAFEEYTRDLTERSWNDFFLTAAQLGYDLIGLTMEVRRLPKRNAPMIDLGGMALGQLALELMFHGLIQKESEILAVLRQLSSSKDDDRNPYVSTLCYALLFAHANRWPIAKLVGQRAVHLAEVLAKTKRPTSHGSVTGREAYYFLTVASRLTAKRPDDLTICDDLLRKAREALTKERVVSGNQQFGEGPAPAPTDIRFEAEATSIEMARLLFRVEERKWNIQNTSWTDEIRAAMKRINEAIAYATTRDAEQVRAATLATLYGNYFTCLLLLENADALGATDRVDLRTHVLGQVRALEVLGRDDVGKLDLRLLSRLDIFLAAYAASFDEYDDTTIQQIEDMYRDLSGLDEDRKSYSLMPYDKRRYEVIERLIEKRGG
jgi:hypothetical protein